MLYLFALTNSTKLDRFQVMKAKEVLNLLKISRSTLSKYVKQGKIQVKVLPSGNYDYDEESVYRLLGQGEYRKNVIYARNISNGNSLDKEISLLTNYCLSKGIEVDEVYQDTGSAFSGDRPQFKKLIQEVFEYKIKKIFVLYPEKLAWLYFDFFQELCARFGTQLIAISKRKNFPEFDQELIFELSFLLEHISKEVVSPHKKQRIELIQKSLQLETEEHS